MIGDLFLMEVDENGKAKFGTCKKCNKCISAPAGNTSRLRKHLTFHPQIFKEFEEKEIPEQNPIQEQKKVDDANIS